MLGESILFKACKILVLPELLGPTRIDILLKLSKDEHDYLKFGQQAKDILLHLAHIKTMIDTTHSRAGEKYTDV